MDEPRYAYEIWYNGRLHVMESDGFRYKFYLKQGQDLAEKLLPKGTKVLAVGGLICKLKGLFNLGFSETDPADYISYKLEFSSRKAYLYGTNRREIKNTMISENDFLKALAEAQARRQNKE